jgi:hypothetical protein
MAPHTPDPAPSNEELSFEQELHRLAPGSVSDDLSSVEQVSFDLVSTDKILSWPPHHQAQLRTDLESLLQSAFPRMPGEDRQVFLGRFFKRVEGGSRRGVFLVRNRTGRLVGSSLFDRREVSWGEQSIKAVYVNLRAILPEYQSFSLGQTMAARVLMDFQPQICMTTCTQSSSLHSWIGLPSKGLVSGFEVYPQLARQGRQSLAVALPAADLPLVVSVFRDMYGHLVVDDQEAVAAAIRNLTASMVRRDVHHGMYDHDPWLRGGRRDPIALALELTGRDGVLVVFRKVP